MNWVAVLIIGALAISAGLNGLIHLIFKLTGGKFDDEE